MRHCFWHAVHEGFGNLRSTMMKLEPVSSDSMTASTTSELDDGDGCRVELIERLEQDDDVQAVFHNLE